VDIVFAFWTPGPFEIAIILGVALLLFGKRLPEVGRSLGKGIIEFKKGIKGIEDDIEEESSRPTRLPPADSVGDEYEVVPRDVPNEGDAKESEARSDDPQKDDKQKNDAPAESSGEAR
jgi:sec-independent protein translocase protein TatA